MSPSATLPIEVVLEQVGEGVILADASGRITFVNEAARRLHGVAELGVPMGQWSETYHLLTLEGEPYPPEQLPLARALQQRETVRDALWRIQRPDGTQILAQGTATPLASTDGQPLGAALIVRDITRDKEVEEALGDARTRLEAALLAGEIATWTFDIVNDRIVADANLARLFSVDPEAAAGGRLDVYMAAIHPDDRTGVAEAIGEAVAGDGNQYEAEYRVVLPDGSFRWLVARGRVERDAVGQAIAMPGVIVDITARKTLEAERAAAAARHEHIAETLQRSLLLTPQGGGNYSGLMLGSVYQAAWDESLVGGDFSDVFRADDHHVALVVGDVTGKGLRAATFTAEVKFALRAFLRESPNPARAFYRLNHYLIESQRLAAPAPEDNGDKGDGTAEPIFVALVIAVVDTRSGEMMCSAGGAEPPLIVRAALPGSECEAIDEEVMACCGPLLGIDNDSDYTAVTVGLQPHDLLALTTDGITEARRPPEPGQRGRGGNFFGMDGLARALREEVTASASSLDDVAQAVAERARAYSGGAMNDDVCLLVVRVPPPNSSDKDRMPL
jgi:PAS domain S-box-containing protein